MFIEEWWIENATNDSCLPKYDSHTQGLSMSSLETAPYGDGVLSWPEIFVVCP